MILKKACWLFVENARDTTHFENEKIKKKNKALIVTSVYDLYLRVSEWLKRAGFFPYKFSG